MTADPRSGDVWWVESPNKKRRPFVVLTRSAAVPVVARLVAAPITSRRRGIPTEVALDEEDGMRHACVVAIDNMQLIPKWAFVERLAILTEERRAAVCRAVAVSIEC